MCVFHTEAHKKGSSKHLHHIYMRNAEPPRTRGVLISLIQSTCASPLFITFIWVVSSRNHLRADVGFDMRRIPLISYQERPNISTYEGIWGMFRVCLRSWSAYRWHLFLQTHLLLDLGKSLLSITGGQILLFVVFVYLLIKYIENIWAKCFVITFRVSFFQDGCRSQTQKWINVSFTNVDLKLGVKENHSQTVFWSLFKSTHYLSVNKISHELFNFNETCVYNWFIFGFNPIQVGRHSYPSLEDTKMAITQIV